MQKKVEVACFTPGCGKSSAMQCPICLKMELEPSYFCSNDCFKSFWPIHKFVHVTPEQRLKKQTTGFKFTGPLRPGIVSPRRKVPESVQKPDYYFTGVPKLEEESRLQKDIEVKSKQDIEKLREVALIARRALDLGHQAAKAGVTTDQLDRIVHEFIVQNEAYPSPLNYYKFPKSICTSPNEVICHGIPDSRPLQTGDILNIDVTVMKHGLNIDLNETFPIGEVSVSSTFLLSKSYQALQEALKLCKPGTNYKEVGNVIQKFCKEHGLEVNRTYSGHGIGKLFHCAPTIPHYGGNKAVGKMREGHVFTIEPMINQGTHRDITWPDKWTAVTADGQRSAQFEHTILVTEGGYELLTARLPESPSLGFI